MTYSADNLPVHYVKHSPTGMSWGYGGSGPADLALSLLMECVGPELTNRYYMDFKWEVVAKLKDDWKLSDEFIKDWINKRKEKQT